MLHALSHWSAAPPTQARLEQSGTQGRLPVKIAVALDQSCEQCLAFAQIATAVASHEHTYMGERGNAPVAILASAQADCLRTVCVFQSRAPPSLA